MAKMKVTLREDPEPDAAFYYRQQFKIYHPAYLIWDMETWKAVLDTSVAYRIEVDGVYAGDVILENRGKQTKYIVDFSLLPQYQGKGIGKTAIKEVRRMSQQLIAITRKETLGFFLKAGFVAKRTIEDYYARGVDGYLIAWSALER